MREERLDPMSESFSGFRRNIELALFGMVLIQTGAEVFQVVIFQKIDLIDDEPFGLFELLLIDVTDIAVEAALVLFSSQCRESTAGIEDNGKRSEGHRCLINFLKRLEDSRHEIGAGSDRFRNHDFGPG